MLWRMLEVAVLERVEVRRDGAVIAVPGGLTSALLVRLALEAGRRVRAERLLDELWSGPSATRRNTLQAKVSQLRRPRRPGAATGWRRGLHPRGGTGCR